MLSFTEAVSVITVIDLFGKSLKKIFFYQTLQKKFWFEIPKPDWIEQRLINMQVKCALHDQHRFVNEIRLATMQLGDW